MSRNKCLLTKMFSLPCSMFQLLMEVETLLLTPTTPQLRIWTAKLYPLTVLFLSLLIQTIFAMGRCCSLSTRSTRRNPRPIAPTATHCRTLTLPRTLCLHLYTIYNIATINMFLCSYSPYPCNSKPLSTVYTH